MDRKVILRMLDRQNDWTFFEATTISREDFFRWCDENGRRRPTFWIGEAPTRHIDKNEISTRGRRPAAASEHREIHMLFDEIIANNKLTFRRGELTRIAADISESVTYKLDSVRRLISPHYRELEATHKNARQPA